MDLKNCAVSLVRTEHIIRSSVMTNNDFIIMLPEVCILQREYASDDTLELHAFSIYTRFCNVSIQSSTFQFISSVYRDKSTIFGSAKHFVALILVEFHDMSHL